MLNYLPLSEDQFLILKNLYYSFNNYLEIANILKISKSAVCCHIKEYISLGSLYKIPKTRDKDFYCFVLNNYTQPVSELVAKTQKNQNQVIACLKILRFYKLIPEDFKIKSYKEFIVSNNCIDNEVWSQSELNYLKDNSSNYSLETLSKNLNKTTFSICFKIYELNLNYKNKHWNFEKDLFLKENFSSSSKSILLDYLKFDWKFITARARLLGYERKEVSINTKETTLEITLEAFLKELKIDYKKQYQIKYSLKYSYYADFLICENIILEAQGDYWHGNPLKFPKPTAFQKQKISKDNIRKNTLENLGYSVYYIWEYDIKKDPESVKIFLKTLLPV